MHIVRKLGILLFAAVAVFLTIPTAVFANGTNDQVPLNMADGHNVTLTPLSVTIITGLLMPFIVALLTKYSSSKLVKAIVGVVLAFVAAVLERARLTDGSAVISTGLLVDVGMVYIPQLTSYLGLWSHVNINQKIAPAIGVG